MQQLLQNLVDGQGIYAYINMVWFFGGLGFLAFRVGKGKKPHLRVVK